MSTLTRMTTAPLGPGPCKADCACEYTLDRLSWHFAVYVLIRQHVTQPRKPPRCTCVHVRATSSEPQQSSSPVPLLGYCQCSPLSRKAQAARGPSCRSRIAGQRHLKVSFSRSYDWDCGFLSHTYPSPVAAHSHTSHLPESSSFPCWVGCGPRLCNFAVSMPLLRASFHVPQFHTCARTTVRVTSSRLPQFLSLQRPAAPPTRLPRLDSPDSCVCGHPPATRKLCRLCALLPMRHTHCWT